MTFSDGFSNLYFVARLGYRGNAEALPIGILLVNSVLGPLFYVLFFFFVRYGAAVQADPIDLLLTAFLLMPVGNAVFFLATIFARLRSWGVLRYVLVSEVGLFEFGLTQVVWAAGFAAVTTLLVALPTMLVVGSSLAVVLNFAIATVIACLSLSAVGLLCAMVIISMRDYLIFTNSMFFIVVLTSGVVDNIVGPVDNALMLNPLRPLVRWLEDTGAVQFWDWRVGLACGVGITYVLCAWAVARIQAKRVELLDI